MINARSETVTEKPAFRLAFRERRCLVPASGFFEWQRDGKLRQPWFFARRDQSVFAFAGLWEPENDLGDNEQRTCAILTTVANDLVRPVHDRMPVMLSADAWHPWLSATTGAVQRRALCEPFRVEEMIGFPVSRKVNRPGAEGPNLIQPIGSGELPGLREEG